jgi:hypothetical protein
MGIDPLSIAGQMVLKQAAKGEHVPSSAIPHAIDAIGNHNGHVDLGDPVAFVEEKVETTKGVFAFLGDVFLGG